LYLKWVTCKNGNWCDLLRVDLSNSHFDDLSGVYIIWSNQTVVRIGSGDIKARISDHRDNPEITIYPDLKITWAHVNRNQMEGVENYLSEVLHPVIGKRFPDCTPIEVNLPWN
jgi:hypothetical protein